MSEINNCFFFNKDRGLKTYASLKFNLVTFNQGSLENISDELSFAETRE